MDFSTYPAFEAQFKDRYGWLEDAYPFAAMVLETELRNLLYGEDEIARRNISRLTKYYFPIDLLLHQVAARGFSDAQIYLEMPGFGQTRQDLSARLQQDGYGIFSDRKFFGVEANKALHKMATMGSAFPKAMKLAHTKGMDALLKDHAALRRLDRSMARNYPRVKAFVAAQRISLFLATGDSKPFSRLLVKAAQELGLPYIVLAHGYISDPVLRTIAPLRADRLIVWSRIQQQLVQAALPTRRDDILTFGFPARVALSQKPPRERRILFAWEPLERKGLKEPHLEILGALAGACLASGVVPVFRPHPKERQQRALLQELEQLGFQIDPDTLGKALSRAACVISSNSTVLTEAAAAGRAAYQLSDLAVFGFEGAQMIAAEGFDPAALLAVPGRASALPPLDAAALYEDLRAMLSHDPA